MCGFFKFLLVILMWLRGQQHFFRKYAIWRTSV